MNDLGFWLVFFSAALALNLSPGPDLIYILSRTVAQGRRIGIASALGVSSGALIHVFAAALGLSAILAASSAAFAVVKFVGAAYLCYLGVRALRSAGSRFEVSDAQAKKRVTAAQAFRQGVLVDAFNPKVAIFFLAFLPQFVNPSAGHVALQTLALGLLVVAVAVVVEMAFVLAAARTTRFFRAHHRASAWLDRLLGSLFIGLGVRLALSEQGR